MLLYPEKYEKYDPVKVLTADYHNIANYKYNNKQYVKISF